MADFIIIDNNTNNVMAELEGYDFIEVVCETDFAAEDEISGEWFSVYFVGDTATEKVAVFDDGKWYEADGYTPLAY